MPSSSGSENVPSTTPPNAKKVVIPHGLLRTPHFSQITDPVDTINPITGRSFYFGARPWRCTDRVMDLTSSMTSFDGPAALKRQWKLFRACAASEPGDEPVDNYYRVSRVEAMYFRDRHVNNMIRYKFFERYPFRGEDLTKVSENDTVRMRTWRYQRLLEKEVETGQALVSTGDLRSNNEVTNDSTPGEVTGGIQAAMMSNDEDAPKPGEVSTYSNLPRDLLEKQQRIKKAQQEAAAASNASSSPIVGAPPSHISGQDEMSDREKKYYEMRSFLQRQKQLEKEKEEVRREGAQGAESSILGSMPWFGKKKGGGGEDSSSSS